MLAGIGVSGSAAMERLVPDRLGAPGWLAWCLNRRGVPTGNTGRGIRLLWGLAGGCGWPTSPDCPWYRSRRGEGVGGLGPGGRVGHGILDRLCEGSREIRVLRDELGRRCSSIFGCNWSIRDAVGPRASRHAAFSRCISCRDSSLGSSFVVLRAFRCSMVSPGIIRQFGGF